MWAFTVHYMELFKGFIFHEGSVHIYRKQAASLAEPMPMQIAQDKRNVDRLLTYIVREDFITRYVPFILFIFHPQNIYNVAHLHLEGC